MKWFRSLSIRIKFVLILVTLTTSMLLFYGSVALRDFQSDKIAYVFESTLSESRSTARQIHSELSFVLDKLEQYLDGYILERFQFSQKAKLSFKNERSLISVWSYHFDPKTGSYQSFDRIGKDDFGILEDTGWEPYFREILKDTISNEITIRTFEANPEQWIVGLRFQPKLDQSPSVVMALVKSADFSDSFSGSTLSDSLLVNGSAEMIIQPTEANYLGDLSDVQGAVDKTIEMIKAPIGTHTYSADQEDWLISMANVGLGNMKVISLIPKSVALEAIRMLVIKSALLLGFIIFLTIALSVWVSSQFTGRINNLYEATKKIAEGDFDFQVTDSSADEISGLAKGFNTMSVEIQRLLSETAEKARMESELNTAKLVQSTLFPSEHFENQSVQIKGYYQPASECGGDWWYFSQIENKTFLWIGDATGHGVPAALVTAAAKSAASVLESFPELPVSQIMKMMNQAIYGTSGGQVLMTFFLGCFDNDTGILTYSSASHDPPFLFLGAKKGSMKKKDVIPLVQASGPRLGESPESTYDQVEVQIEASDRIIFYTDGVPELKNHEAKMLGERKFIKTLMASFNEDKNLETSMLELHESIEAHREDAPLEDDVTYFMFEHKRAS